MTQAVLRSAAPADIAAIRRVSVAAGARFGTLDDHRLAQRADDPPIDPDAVTAAIEARLAWVAEVEGDLVGFLVAEPLDGDVHVEEVSVDPGHAGAGIGAALLACATEAALDRAARVTLTTFRDVPWNRPYYERLGFRTLPEHDIGPELATRRAEEDRAGLDASMRVAMARR